jgi:hypothetical protein
MLGAPHLRRLIKEVAIAQDPHPSPTVVNALDHGTA